MTVSTLKKHISFLTNEQGERVAVQLDLKSKPMRELFEDLYDTFTAIERQNEPTKTFDEVKNRMLAQRKK